MGILDKVFGDYSSRQVKRIIPVVNKIDSLDDESNRLTEEELAQKTVECKER